MPRRLYLMDALILRIIILNLLPGGGEYCIGKCIPRSNPENLTIVTLKIPGSVDGTQVSLGKQAFDWAKNGANYSNLEVNLIFTKVDNMCVQMPADCSYIFREYNELPKIAKISIDLSGIDTSNVTNMTGMFQNCSKLTSLDLSNFNTSKVTKMLQMFYLCSGLTSLNVSSFDTSNVTNMGSIFRDCTRLTSLNVSNFDTSNVVTANSLFNGCSNLTSLDLSNFDTNAFENVGHMFYGCTSLTYLDLSNFTGSKIADHIDNMFNGCTSLTYLDISNIDANNTIDIGGMFKDCSALSTLKISEKFSPPTDTVTELDTMFSGCNSNINIIGTKVSQFIIANATVKSKINADGNKVYIYQSPSTWISADFKKIVGDQLGITTFTEEPETTDISKIFSATSEDSVYIAQNEGDKTILVDGADKTIAGALTNKTIDGIGYYPANLQITGNIPLSGNNFEFNQKLFIVGDGIKNTTVTLSNPKALPKTETSVEANATLNFAGTEKYDLSSNLSIKSGGRIVANGRLCIANGATVQFF